MFITAVHVLLLSNMILSFSCFLYRFVFCFGAFGIVRVWGCKMVKIISSYSQHVIVEIYFLAWSHYSRNIRRDVNFKVGAFSQLQTSTITHAQTHYHNDCNSQNVLQNLDLKSHSCKNKVKCSVNIIWKYLKYRSLNEKCQISQDVLTFHNQR